MQKEERLFILLNDILDKCVISQNIVQTFSKKEFLVNQTAQLAVERCLEIISIRANFYLRLVKNKNIKIHSILYNVAYWQRKLNHNYQKLPADTIWKTVKELHSLEALMRDMLRDRISDKITTHRNPKSTFVLNPGENVPLSPKYLDNYVAPYLAAIQDIQR